MEPSFPWIDKDWFEKHSFGPVNPSIAYRQWTEFWDRTPRNVAQSKVVNKLMELASGKHRTAISKFESETQRYQLSPSLQARFVLLKQAIFGKDIEEEGDSVDFRLGSTTRIAFVTDLTNVPSLLFHHEIIRDFASQLEKCHYSITLHDIAGTSRNADLERFAHTFAPHAVVMLRMTPHPSDLHIFRESQIPVLLIHGDTRTYEPPVIAHIFPDQNSISADIGAWAKQQGLCPGLPPDRVPVVVAMPREHSSESLRDRRIDQIMKGMTPYQADLEIVDDYDASRAAPIYRRRPNASAFVCLSDQLAVAFKQLCEAATGSSPPILGFDHREISKREGLWSFDQRTDEIGKLLADLLTEWFARQTQENGSWPDCKEIALPVRLAKP